MTRKNVLFVALAVVMLATSCSQEENGLASSSSNSSNSKQISIYPSVNYSRAVETSIDNLQDFYVTAFQEGEANYMAGVKYSKSGDGYGTDAGTFFWPADDSNLHFYAYAPAKPGKEGYTFDITSTTQKMENFSPNDAAADQQDFVYAFAKGNKTGNANDGIAIDFKHALSEITISAKNTNTAYTIEVSGVKLGGIKNKGTFTFPSYNGDGTNASWTQNSQTGDYTTSLSEAVTLGSDATDFSAKGNVPFMLIPQSLTSTSKAYDGAYIALKVSIAMQGGKVLCSDKWAYVGIGDSWEMGKRYNYTLDFSNGAGQDADGNLIISGKGIKLSVNMKDWTAEEFGDVEEKFICGTADYEFTYYVGGLDGTSYKVTPGASGNWSIPVAVFEGITSTKYMFSECGSITSLDLSNFDTRNVTDMGAMFFDCLYLETIRMAGCSEATINKIKTQLASDGITGCTIVTE